MALLSVRHYHSAFLIFREGAPCSAVYLSLSCSLRFWHFSLSPKPQRFRGFSKATTRLIRGPLEDRLHLSIRHFGYLIPVARWEKFRRSPTGWSSRKPQMPWSRSTKRLVPSSARIPSRVLGTSRSPVIVSSSVIRVEQSGPLTSGRVHFCGLLRQRQSTTSSSRRAEYSA